MNRRKRLELLENYVESINRGVSDLPLNENRFVLTAYPDERGSGVLFYFHDNQTGEEEMLKCQFTPVPIKGGQYLYPSDVFWGFNDFVIRRTFTW